MAPPPIATPGFPAAPRALTAYAQAPAAANPVSTREIGAPDAVYGGAFVQDQTTDVISGDREIKFFDGWSYQGPLKDSREEGSSTYIWADGLRYVGPQVNEVQQGERTGTFRQKSGNINTGQWLRRQRDGAGVEEWADGQRYQGVWKASRAFRMAEPSTVMAKKRRWSFLRFQ